MTPLDEINQRLDILQKFYDLAIKERDYERVVSDRLSFLNNRLISKASKTAGTIEEAIFHLERAKDMSLDELVRAEHLSTALYTLKSGRVL